MWESHERRTIIFLLELKVQRSSLENPSTTLPRSASDGCELRFLFHDFGSLCNVHFRCQSCCRDASTEFVGIAASSSIQAASNTDAKLSCFCRELRHRPAGAFTKKCTNDGNKKETISSQKDLKKLQVQQRSLKV